MSRQLQLGEFMCAAQPIQRQFNNKCNGGKTECHVCFLWISPQGLKNHRRLHQEKGQYIPNKRPRWGKAKPYTKPLHATNVSTTNTSTTNTSTTNATSANVSTTNESTTNESTNVTICVPINVNVDVQGELGDNDSIDSDDLCAFFDPINEEEDNEVNDEDLDDDDKVPRLGHERVRQRNRRADEIVKVFHDFYRINCTTQATCCQEAAYFS